MSGLSTDRPFPLPHTHTHAHTRIRQKHTWHRWKRAHMFVYTHTHTSCCSVGEIHQRPSRQTGSIRKRCSKLVLTLCLPCISSATHKHTHPPPHTHSVCYSFQHTGFCPHHHTLLYVLLILPSIPQKYSSTTQVSTMLHDAVCVLDTQSDDSE